MKTTRIQDVKNYLNSNVAPMAWQRIQIRLLPDFNKKGFFFHTMTDDRVLDAELIVNIDSTVKELYNLSLPSEFLN